MMLSFCHRSSDKVKTGSFQSLIDLAAMGPHGAEIILPD